MSKVKQPIAYGIDELAAAIDRRRGQGGAGAV
jgi:hypothetical protein